MTNYVIRRTFFAILTFFGITILVYWMSALAPGSPLDSLLADPGMTLAEVERRKAELGLDQPVYIQYFTWLKELLKGNWGYYEVQKALYDDPSYIWLYHSDRSDVYNKSIGNVPVLDFSNLNYNAYAWTFTN